jgi:hypothetical protein
MASTLSALTWDASSLGTTPKISLCAHATDLNIMHKARKSVDLLHSLWLWLTWTWLMMLSLSVHGQKLISVPVKLLGGSKRMYPEKIIIMRVE